MPWRLCGGRNLVLPPRQHHLARSSELNKAEVWPGILARINLLPPLHVVKLGMIDHAELHDVFAVAYQGLPVGFEL